MCRVLPPLAFMWLAFAPAPPHRPKPVPEAMKVMQGSWAIQEWGTAAMRVPVPILRGPWRKEQMGDAVLLPSAAEVIGDSVVFQRTGGGPFRWRVRADPDRRSKDGGQMEIVGERGGKMLGIYRLQGDTLTICYRDEGKGCPGEFTDEGQWKLVLKRKKP